jgi:hypothetical protein
MTLLGVVMVYYGVISPLNYQLRQEATRLGDEQRKLGMLKNQLGQMERFMAEAAKQKELLADWKERVPTGVVVRWYLDQALGLAYTNEISSPDIKTPSILSPGEKGNLGYGRVSVGVVGIGRYAQLGKFVADFENTFPFTEVQTLKLEMGSAGGGLYTEPDPEVLGLSMSVESLAERPVVR